MKNIEEYLKDAKGQASSTRLFSWVLLKFFIILNVIIPVLGGLLIYLMGKGLDPSILLGAGIIWLVLDALLGIMIFTPKQMGKIQEIKELIELAKGKS